MLKIDEEKWKPVLERIEKGEFPRIMTDELFVFMRYVALQDKEYRINVTYKNKELIILSDAHKLPPKRSAMSI